MRAAKRARTATITRMIATARMRTPIAGWKRKDRSEDLEDDDERVIIFMNPD